MNNNNSTTHKSGFSLVELLLVISVVLILLGISVFAFNGAFGATELTQAGDTVLQEMVNAQQRAIRDSSHVEVRVYQPDDFVDVQVWKLLLVRQKPDETFEALSSPYTLPVGVIFSRSSNLSTLIDEPDRQTDNQNLLSDLTSYTAFRFNGNGSTNLNSITSNLGDTWHLTLISSNEDGSDNNPPDNFYTISIEPSTGSVKTYRP